MLRILAQGSYFTHIELVQKSSSGTEEGLGWGMETWNIPSTTRSEMKCVKHFHGSSCTQVLQYLHYDKRLVVYFSGRAFRGAWKTVVRS